MRRKRILVAASTYPPAFGGSGLETHQLYKRLQKSLPIEVTALTQSGRGQEPGIDRFEGITVYRIDRNLSLPIQFLTVGRLMLQQGFRTFDLLHAKDGLPIALSACLWARVLGTPTIRHITSVRDGPIPQAWKESFFRSTFTQAGLLHAKNDSVVSVYLSMGLSEQRIWISPYPVDTRQFRFPTSGERRAARKALGFSDGDIVHFILGRIHAHKNQSLAIEALSLLPDRHKLVLAGPADQDYVDTIHSSILQLGVDARVVLLPERQYNPVPLYHAADIYLIPSVSEGGPCVMVEALCCGVPVVVNESIGVRQFVRDGREGYNVPLLASAFARAAERLEDIVHDLDYRRELAQRSASMYGAEALDPEFARRILGLLKAD